MWASGNEGTSGTKSKGPNTVAFIAIYFWKKKPRPKNSRLPLSEVIKDKDTSPFPLYEMRYGGQESDGEYDVVSPSDRNTVQRSDSQTEPLKTEIREEDV